MTGRALAAIVLARLRADRRTILYACVTATVAGLAVPRNPAAPAFFCCALGIAAALLQTPGRHRTLDVCEESAPLFGRELARAKALVPCLFAAFASVAYAAPAFAARIPDAFTTFAIALFPAIACAVVALGASIRQGPPRALYVGFACVVAVAAYLIATASGSLAGEIAFCAAVAFVALRQYGEALARYDPVP